jgi:hypothetical protein
MSAQKNSQLAHHDLEGGHVVLCEELQVHDGQVPSVLPRALGHDMVIPHIGKNLKKYHVA